MSVTLTTALKNAQTVLSDRTRYCLNHKFEADLDLSHRATIQQLMARVKELPEKDDKAKKRLIAVLGLIYPSEKAEPKDEDAARGSKKPASIAKRFAARCKAFVTSKPATTQGKSKQGNPKVPETALAVVKKEYQNESNGIFESLSLDLRRLIAQYVGVLESDIHRFMFSKCYPDLSEKMFSELLQEIAKRDSLDLYRLKTLVHQLQELNKSSSSPRVIDDGFKLVFDHCKDLSKFTWKGRIDKDVLKRIALILPSNVVIRFDSSFTDKDAEILANNSPKLHGIDLSSCSGLGLSSDGLLRLVTICEDLKELALPWMLDHINAVLRKIMPHCKKLRVLDLDGCDVTDEGLIPIATNCPKLRVLYLNNCDVTNAGVQALADNCHELQVLDLSGCDQITAAGLLKLAEKCKQLKIIYLRNPDINLSELSKALLELLPNLKIIIRE